MITICLTSDNHGNISILKQIKMMYPNCDYYFHAGDSQLNLEQLQGWCSVLGNTDFETRLPQYKKISIGQTSILLLHSHLVGGILEMSSFAQSLACQFVFFGHTHCFTVEKSDGITLINPASLSYNRDGSEPSFCLVNLDEERAQLINVERIFIKDLSL